MLHDRVLAIVTEWPGVSAAEIRELLPDAKHIALKTAIASLLRTKAIESAGFWRLSAEDAAAVRSRRPPDGADGPADGGALMASRRQEVSRPLLFRSSISVIETTERLGTRLRRTSQNVPIF